jgi:glycosyltransferase involved in cell wall biosynthesis
MPKLVCMLRVKDGILFIHEWLKNMDKLVDEIVVVDNGSTDGTYEVLQTHPKVVDIARTHGFHEGRDKILAYEMARKRNPDWMLWLDVDEIFEERLTRSRLNKMMNSKIFKKYYFRRFHFHRDKFHVEGGYDKLKGQSVLERILWKEDKNGYFENSQIHNGLIKGINGMGSISHIRIKHFGAVDKEYLIRKTNVYLTIDPSRSEMYIKHRDQNLPVYKWHEYSESRLLVTLQNMFMDVLMMMTLVKKKLKLK